MSYPPFKLICLWRPLRPLMAVSGHGFHTPPPEPAGDGMPPILRAQRRRGAGRKIPVALSDVVPRSVFPARKARNHREFSERPAGASAPGNPQGWSERGGGPSPACGPANQNLKVGADGTVRRIVSLPKAHRAQSSWHRTAAATRRRRFPGRSAATTDLSGFQRLRGYADQDRPARHA